MKLRLNWRSLNSNFFLVVPDLPHQAYIGSDILVRLKAQLDTINNVVWSLPLAQETDLDSENLQSCQSIYNVCDVANKQNRTIPAHTKNVIVRLNIKSGQHRIHSQLLFQPSPLISKLGLSMDATSSIEPWSKSICLLMHNDSEQDILLPKSTTLGWLIDTELHNFGPITGNCELMPDSLLPDNPNDGIAYTKPLKSIAIFCWIRVILSHTSYRRPRFNFQNCQFVVR